jgi:hypothetical protein
MKPIHKLVIAATMVLAVGIVAFAADKSAPQDTNKTGIFINFNGIDVDTVLATYKGYSTAELVVASNVRNIHAITLHATDVSAEVGQHLIEQALLKQAGVVITRLEDKRISVTYNDRLKLEP